MSEELNHIDGLFREPIEGHTETPPENVWTEIDACLERKRNNLLQEKYNRLKRLTALLLLLLAGGIVYHNIKINGHAASVTADDNKYAAVKKTGTPAKENITPADKISTGNNIQISEVDNTEKNKAVNNPGGIARANNLPASNNKAVKTEIEKIVKPDQYLNIGNRTNVTKDNATETVLKMEKAINSNHKIRQSATIKIINTGGEIGDNNSNENISAATTVLPAINKRNEVIANSMALSPIEKVSAEKIVIEKPASKISVHALTNSFASAFPSPRKKTALSAGRFAATIYFSPEIAFNRIEDGKQHGDRGPGGGPDRLPDERRRIKDGEHTAVSFNTGVLIDYALSRSFSIQSGISYTNKSTETSPKKIFAEADNSGNIKYKYNCSFGSAYIDPKTGALTAAGDSATANSGTNRIQYIGIPANISYHLSFWKIQVNPTIGTTINFLIGQHITTNITDASGSSKQSSAVINGLKSSYLSGNAGIAFIYQFNRRFGLSVMPAAGFALSSVNSNSAVESYPNTFGVLAGLRIKL